MKHCLFKLAVFLILGSIVNVVIAWSCALWAPVTSGVVLDKDQSDKLDINSHNLLRADTGFGYKEFKPVMYPTDSEWKSMEMRRITVANGGRFTFSLDFTPSFPMQAKELPGIEEVRAGWPAPSLMSQQRQVAPFGEHPIESFNNGIFQPEWTYQFNPIAGRRIPLRPMWPGFAINTILYAVILWSLTLGPFTARRVIRRKRGHCPKCGYYLRGEFTSGCSECGWQGVIVQQTSA